MRYPGEIVRSIVTLACFIFALCGGCRPTGATAQQLRARAAFDLKCSEKELQVVTIDEQTRGVRGCGQQATYVHVCRGPYEQSDCSWVLNGDSRSAK